MTDFKRLYTALETRVDEAVSLLHMGDSETALLLLIRCQKAKARFDKARNTGEPIDLDQLFLH